MVPVSVRAEEERGALGNRVAAMMAPLPVWCEDPVERLRLVTRVDGRPEELRPGGRRRDPHPDHRLRAADDRLPGGAAAAAPSASSTSSSPTCPGPQFPLYVLGRKMEAIFPMVPLARRQALCVGIMSYNGQVDFGLVGDYDAMADLDSFALDLEGAVEEISATVAPAAKRRVRRKAQQDSEVVLAPGVEG